MQDAARCCIIQMELPFLFWNHLLDKTCYTLNLSSQCSVQDNKTFWEIFYTEMVIQRSIPDVSHL